MRRSTMTPLQLEVRSLRVINNQLWCCCLDSVIVVFDLGLTYVCDIRFPDMGAVQGVVDVGDGTVVAAENGLFMISYAGKIKGL